MSLIVPAVLPKSHDELLEKLALLEKIPEVSRIQIDVVDGRFAAPASWPYTNLQGLRPLEDKGEFLPRTHRFEYEIDLMCFDFMKAAAAWLALGARRLTFHAETMTNISRAIHEIRTTYGGSESFSLGVALNSTTPVTTLEPVLSHVDYVQFMGITTIGKQGQPFAVRTIERVRDFHKKYPGVSVQVDGGVSLINAPALFKAGASSLIVGSAILRAKNPVQAVQELHALVIS